MPVSMRSQAENIVDPDDPIAVARQKERHMMIDQ